MRVLKNSFWFVLLMINFGGLSMANVSEDVIKEISTCPESPNCVSTLTTSKSHKMEAWPIKGPDTLKKIKAAALKEPRAELISESETHLHFTFKSFVFRFVDDFWVAVKNDKIHYKSAARTGYKDFDKNKERVERIKERVYN